MNRRELLREMSRVQATWVNRNAPGTGDVDIAVEDEQDYLTRIAAVFERAREDVRRKRGRSVTVAPPAVAAQAAIGALLLAYDPDQKRGPGGRWAKVGDDMPSGDAFDGVARPGSPQRLSPREFGEKVPQGSRFYRGVTSTEAAAHTREGGLGGGDYGPGIYMDPRIAVAQSYSGRSGGTVMRLGLKPGTKVKTIPQRVQLRGSAAVDEWAREGGHDVISTGDGTYTIVRNPDVLIVDERDYTPRESTILEYLNKGYDMPDGYEAEIEVLQRDGVFSTLDAFKYDPNQRRGLDGRWAKGGGAGIPDVGLTLRKGIESGIADRRPLSGGAMASVDLVTFNDGTRAVRKHARKVPTGRSPKDQQDAEELAGKIARAIGVKTPAIERTSDAEIFMEYEEDDDPGTMLRGGEIDRLAATPEGIRMGLLDVLIANPDRHPGNYLVNYDQDRITAIDHGFAWDDPEDFYPSVFARNFGRTSPLSPADIAELRPKIEGLRADFERMGHLDWYEQVTDVFEQVAQRSNGAERILR